MSFLHERKCEFNFQPPTTLVLLAFHKNGLIKICPFFKDVIAYGMLTPPWMVHPSLQHERRPFWNGWSYCIKKYGVEIVVVVVIVLVACCTWVSLCAVHNNYVTFIIICLLLFSLYYLVFYLFCALSIIDQLTADAAQ